MRPWPPPGKAAILVIIVGPVLDHNSRQASCDVSWDAFEGWLSQISHDRETRSSLSPGRIIVATPRRLLEQRYSNDPARHGLHQPIRDLAGRPIRAIG